MIKSAYGLVLLFTSNQDGVLVTGPYPPVVFILQQFRSQKTQDYASRLETYIKEAKLLDNIGIEKKEQELTNRVLSFAKDHLNSMREETTIESSIRKDDLKQCLE